MTDFGQGVHLDRFPEMHIQIFQDLVDSLPEMFILFAADGIKPGQFAEQNHEQPETEGSAGRGDRFTFREEFPERLDNRRQSLRPDMKKRIEAFVLPRHEELLETGQLAEVELRHRQTLGDEEQIEERKFLFHGITVCEAARNHEDVSASQRRIPVFRQMNSFPVIDADKLHAFVRVKFRGILILFQNHTKRKIRGIAEQIS